MNSIRLRFLYGHEFWDKLEELLNNAQERVFLVSAYIGRKTYLKYISLIPKNVYSLTVCRNDSSFIPSEALVINQNYFHGKIYLVDDTIIIGSQNLHDASKEGEFSTLIETDTFNSSLILYQALLKLIEKEPISAEPIHSDFISLYDYCCPFCGNSFMPDPISLHSCPGYNHGGFVSDEDCQSYGDEGSCKYCLPENRIPIGDAICCDDSGCGLGISLNDNHLIYHAINPATPKELSLAREYLKLFNYFKSRNIDTVELFRILGFVGEVYKTSLERKEHKLINLEIYKNIQDRLSKYEPN